MSYKIIYMQLFVFLKLLVLNTPFVYAEMGPPVSNEKKLIGWAVNAVDSIHMHQHVRELEDEYALDGMVITLQPDYWEGDKFQAWALFGGRKYKRDDFKQALTNLKATRFKRFTDNFLYVSTSVRGTNQKKYGNLDWFDNRWHVITENMALFASLAREVGFKGLMLDVEHYEGRLPLWKYFNYKSFSDYLYKAGQHIPGHQDYLNQARKRGNEMMEAVTIAYPNITIIIIPFTGWDDSGYDFLSSFVDGMLEGAGPETTIIDGGEGGYPLQTFRSFMDLRKEAQMKGVKKSQVAQVYREKMKYGFGVWLDYIPDRFGGWHTKEDALDKNYRSPLRMEHALYNALTASDKYVWLYVWHPEYWWNLDTRKKENHQKQQKQCVLCPHSVLPQAYLDVFRNCRKLHNLEWKP